MKPGQGFKLRSAVAAIAVCLSGTALADMQTFHCKGQINGVTTGAVLQIEAGGFYAGPFVGGRLQNAHASYQFNGELFGGSQGYVSLVESPGGARIDRVWIGIGNGGFALRTEDGAFYAFNCR